MCVVYISVFIHYTHKKTRYYIIKYGHVLEVHQRDENNSEKKRILFTMFSMMRFV